MLDNILIPAATEAIEYECDTVIPTQYDEYYSGGDTSIWLRQKPLLSVELVQEGWGWTNYDLTFIQVNSIPADDDDTGDTDALFRYSIDNAQEGVITRRFGGNVVAPFVSGENNIRVVYTAGLDSVPAVLQLAALELVAHWYQGALQRNPGTGNAYDAMNTDFTRSEGVTSLNSGLPYRILELIKAYRNAPYIG
jgi:hypothetical protein